MLYFKAQTYNTVLVLVNKSSFKHTHTLCPPGRVFRVLVVMIKYGFLLWQVKLECGWAVCVGVWRALLVPLLLVTDGTDHQKSNISLLLLALSLSPVCPFPHTVWLVLPRSKIRHFLPSCPHPSSCTQTHTAGQNRSCLSLSMYRFLFLSSPHFLSHLLLALSVFLVLFFLFFFFSLSSSMLGHLGVTLQPGLRCGDRRPT